MDKAKIREHLRNLQMWAETEQLGQARCELNNIRQEAEASGHEPLARMVADTDDLVSRVMDNLYELLAVLREKVEEVLEETPLEVEE